MRAARGVRLLAAVLVVFLVTWGAEGSAQTVLRLCLGGDAAAPGAYAAPSGPGLTLQVTRAGDPAGGCSVAVLPLGPDEVAAAWLAPPRVAASLARGAALVAPSSPASAAGSGYWEALDGAGAASSRAPAPLFVDLLDTYAPAAFGAEGRAAWRRVEGGGLEIACGGGSRPAGVTLDGGGWLRPPGKGLELALERQGGGHEVGLSDAARRRTEDPLMLGVVPRDGGDEVRLAVPDRGLSLADPLSVTLRCPAEPATLRLADMRLELPVTERPLTAATWVWEPAAWRVDGGRDLLARLQAEGMDRVLVTVPVRDGRVAEPSALAAFVAAARARGVAVWAVEGDPHAVLEAERPGFVARTRALAAYNARAAAKGRLAGIQYDIEPYLLPGYALDPAAWLAALGDLVAELADAAGDTPVDVAIPFWMSREPGGEALMARLAGSVRSVTVMAYRTDPREIQLAAADALAWGDAAGRQVLVALELGPIEEEVRTVFRPAARGRLWAVPVGGRTALVLLKGPRENPAGLAFEPQAGTPVDPAKTSFLADHKRVRRILPALTRAWLRHGSFAGTALHGLPDLAEPGR